MKRFNTYYIGLLLLGGLGITACSPEEDGGGGSQNGSAKEVTLSGISDTKWSYFSFSEGVIVGTSEFGSTDEDASWKTRSDWDIAFCGPYIRTNGGSSGNGKGAIQRIDDATFETVTAGDGGTFETDAYQQP